MDKKILFISHDASRTGATIVLIHFLKWLRDHTDISFDILIKNKKGGALLSDFRSLAPVSVYSESLSGKIESMAGMFKRNDTTNTWTMLARKIFGMRFKRKNIGLIYSNTITNGEILKILSDGSCPVISHVHELEWGIQYYGLSRFDLTKRFSNRFIAVSQAVKNNLIENHHIPSERIDLHYEFIPVRSVESTNTEKARKKICQENNIPENSVIVCASGTTGWRKGPDLFVQLSLCVSRLIKDIPLFFLWVGGQQNGLEYNNLVYDISKSGLSNWIRFVGEREHPFDYFAASDIFAMVSREDPFPLVCLEAAALGKPIVCFDLAGGMKEFVEGDAGIVVPYLDIAAMARACAVLIRSGELRSKLGNQAKVKVKKRHDLDVAAPKLLDIISNTIEKF